MPRSLRTAVLTGSRLRESALRAHGRELCAMAGLPRLKLDPGMVEVLIYSPLMAALGDFAARGDGYSLRWFDLDATTRANLAEVLNLWVRAAAWCESPIEKLMLWAMLGHGVAANGFVIRGRDGVLSVREPGLYVQQPVCGFVADFVLVGPPRALVIECDGHEFHARREHMARDRKRDRDLQLDGYTVLRFTGSQIHTDPNACAREVDAHRGAHA